MVFGDFGGLLSGPFVQLGQGVVNAVPGIVAAIVILLLGWLIGVLLGHVVKKVLVHTKLLTTVVGKLGLQEEVGKLNLPHFFALLTKWYVFVVFLNPAAQVVSLTGLADFFRAAALWIPNIILAIVIALAGYVLAEYVAKKIREIKVKKNSLLASSAKALAMVFVVLVVLRQVGIEVSVAENAFLIVLGGLMLGVGIALGLGLKDDVQDLVREVRKRL